MSNRRRRRRLLQRENRLNHTTNPATRTVRPVLARELERGLRSRPVQSILRLRDKQEAKRIEPRPVVIDNRRVYRRQSLPVRKINRLAVQQNKIGLISVGKYGKLQLDLPYDHPICRLRRERRELMFATHKAGKGGQKRPKQPVINIRCE